MKFNIENLALIFGAEDAVRIMDVVYGRVDVDSFESVQACLKACYNEPCIDHLQLLAINEIISGFGIEAVEINGRYYNYVNLGETYATTVMTDPSGRFFLTSWGDLVEALERLF